MKNLKLLGADSERFVIIIMFLIESSKDKMSPALGWARDSSHLELTLEMMKAGRQLAPELESNIRGGRIWK